MRDFIHVDLSDFPNTVNIQIVDDRGSMVYQNVVEVNRMSMIFLIDSSRFSRGVYFILVFNNTKKARSTVFKE